MVRGINQRLTLPSKASVIWYQMNPVSVHGGRIGVSYPQSLSDILRETPTAGVDEEDTGVDSAIDIRPESQRQRDGGWEQPAELSRRQL